MNAKEISVLFDKYITEKQIEDFYEINESLQGNSGYKIKYPALENKGIPFMFGSSFSVYHTTISRGYMFGEGRWTSAGTYEIRKTPMYRPCIFTTFGCRIAESYGSTDIDIYYETNDGNDEEKILTIPYGITGYVNVTGLNVKPVAEDDYACCVKIDRNEDSNTFRTYMLQYSGLWI